MKTFYKHILLVVLFSGHFILARLIKNFQNNVYDVSNVDSLDNSISLNKNKRYPNDLIRNIVTSIEFWSHIEKYELIINRFNSLLDFTEANSDKLNLDGLFGLRIAEGSLQSIVDQTTKTSFDDDHLNKVVLKLENLCKQLLKRINLLTAIGLNNTRQDDFQYFKKFFLLINKPFILKTDKINSRLDYDDFGNMIVPQEQPTREELNETFSDNCYSILLKSLNESDIEKRCASIDDCLRYYTTPGTQEYFLTHQLLFFIMTQYVNCSNSTTYAIKNYLMHKGQNVFLNNTLNSNEQTKNSLELQHKIFNYFCTKIYKEAELYALAGIDRMPKDLFIEQIVLCGAIGFDEFFNQNWLNIVLRLQQLNGCFGQNPGNVDGYFNLDEITAIKYELLNDLIESISRQAIDIQHNFQKHPRRRIHKRNDKPMGHGCSSHETGLGAGVYGLELKKIFDALIETIFIKK